MVSEEFQRVLHGKTKKCREIGSPERKMMQFGFLERKKNMETGMERG